MKGSGNNMEITFFIGNGFDLANGLSTSYIDFYNHILKENKEKNILNKENIFLKEIKDFMEKDDDIDVQEGESKYIDWSDFERALGAYTANLKDTDAGSKYLDDLQDVRDAFIDYITKQEEQFKIDKESARAMFNELSFHFYKGIRTHEENTIESYFKNHNSGVYNFNFVNFNYTNTLNKVISQTSKITDSNSGIYIAKSPIHVHRTLNTGTLLGVNDVSQIAKPDIFEADDIRDIIKPEMQNYDDGTIVPKIDKLIAKTNIFVIYGMSMGITDKTWWDKIATQLINYNKYLIINKHMIDSEKATVKKHPRTRRKFIESVENEFVNNLNLEDKDKDKVLERTFVILGSDYIFKYDTSKSKA